MSLDLSTIRNLPENGLCYIMTVMVTAAVNLDLFFTRKRINFSLLNTGQVSNPIHYLSNLQSPVFLKNSRMNLFFAINLPFDRL